MEQPTNTRLVEASGDDPSRERSMRLRFSVAISVGAVALAATHLIWPHAKLDSVTLVLLVIALLPWLGAIFKSIKLPWLEVQYWQQLQLVQQRTDHLDSRLAAVETQVFHFTGATTAQQTRLDESLRVYAAYLDALGLSWDKNTLPKVTINPGMPSDDPPGVYEPAANEIVLAPDAVDDVAVVLRQYTGALPVSIDSSGRLFL